MVCVSVAEMDDMLPESSIRPHPTPPSVLALTADRPFYHNGILKANVSWTAPEGKAFTDQFPLTFQLLISLLRRACFNVFLSLFDATVLVIKDRRGRYELLPCIGP